MLFVGRITGNQYAVAVTTADGQQSDVGVLIPNILLIDLIWGGGVEEVRSQRRVRE